LRKGDSQPDWWNLGGEVRKKIIEWDTAPEQSYFDELFRVSRNQIIWGGNYFQLPITRCFLIWRKTNVPLEGFSMAPCEYAWTSFNENAKIFEFSAVGQPGRFHPTQKPVELYEWIYRNFAKDGDKILDTHLGSGSSRIAAHNLGLDFTGYEIDKEYFDKQEKRFEKHTAQENLFLME
jgi:site-specific DNA-methyltransferase (adenine-specific)